MGILLVIGIAGAVFFAITSISGFDTEKDLNESVTSDINTQEVLEEADEVEENYETEAVLEVVEEVFGVANEEDEVKTENLSKESDSVSKVEPASGSIVIEEEVIHESGDAEIHEVIEKEITRDGASLNFRQEVRATGPVRTKTKIRLDTSEN